MCEVDGTVLQLYKLRHSNWNRRLVCVLITSLPFRREVEIVFPKDESPRVLYQVLVVSLSIIQRKLVLNHQYTFGAHPTMWLPEMLQGA